MQDKNWPQWTTELTTNFVPGEDQLGLEGAAQGYQHWLIPGITTVTDRARYYSFYAWILHRFINLPNSSRLIKDFRGSFFKRHEVAMILGAYSHHFDRESIGGVIGSGPNNSKVRRWWDSSDPVSLETNYFQNTLGGFGQYYVIAMQAMGILGASEQPNWVYPLTPRGEALALAYQKSISQSTYSMDLAEQEQLSVLSHTNAQEFGKLGCLCPEALASGDDLPLLRQTFFRLEENDKENPHIRRRLALAVVLDLVRGAGGLFRREFLRPALYLGEYKTDLPYIRSPELQDWVTRWKLVEIRHLYTFGLQCLWAAFLLQLRKSQGGITFIDFTNWLKEVLSGDKYGSPLREYLDDLCNDVGLARDWLTVHQDFDLACLQGSHLDEYSLYLKALRAPTNEKTLLECGVRILAQTFLRFNHWHTDSNPIWQEMANRERLPLAAYFNFMQEILVTPVSTLGDWLERLYREYIFGQHELMALNKLRYQGYDTFKFSYRDGLFFWPFARPDAYREPIRLAANRLLNALTILTDLGLVVRNEEGEYSLLPDGNDLFEQCIRRIHHDY